VSVDFWWDSIEGENRSTGNEACPIGRPKTINQKKDSSPQPRTGSENFQHHEDFRVLMGYYKITEEI